MSLIPLGFWKSKSDDLASSLQLDYDFGNLASYNVNNPLVVNDLSDKGNHGVAANASAWAWIADFGGYARFEAWRQSYLRTQKTNSHFGIQNGSYSLLYIIKRFTGGEQFVFGNLGTNTFREMLHSGVRDSGVLHSHFGAGVTTGNNVIAVSIWYHIVCTYDVTQITPENPNSISARIYINGVEIVSGSVTSMLGNGELVLGTWGSGGAFYSYIDVGRAQVYNKTLSQAEITTLFNSQKTRFGI